MPIQQEFDKQLQPDPLAKIGSVIAISSCKGGVGKSTVAAHFAMELARRGKKTGLLDADLFGPSIPSLFNAQTTKLEQNRQRQFVPIEINGLKIMSFGFLLGDSPAVMRGPIVTRYIHQILFNTDWGELDYLLIDMPPGTGDIQLTMTQSLRLSGAVIVTTPQTLSLLDVARGILMFERVSVPILGLVDNMAYYICDQCQTKHYVFGKNTSQVLNRRFGLETLAEIPLDPVITENIANGPQENSLITAGVDRMLEKLKETSLEKDSLPEVKLGSAYMHFKWPDGREGKVSNRGLRLSCRCALCIHEETGEKLLDEKKIREDISPLKVIPLGNYAIGIEWNDGHSSGIYPYNHIEGLLEPA